MPIWLNPAVTSGLWPFLASLGRDFPLFFPLLPCPAHWCRAVTVAPSCLWSVCDGGLIGWSLSAHPGEWWLHTKQKVPQQEKVIAPWCLYSCLVWGVREQLWDLAHKRSRGEGCSSGLTHPREPLAGEVLHLLQACPAGTGPLGQGRRNNCSGLPEVLYHSALLRWMHPRQSCSAGEAAWETKLLENPVVRIAMSEVFWGSGFVLSVSYKKYVTEWDLHQSVLSSLLFFFRTKILKGNFWMESNCWGRVKEVVYKV